MYKQIYTNIQTNYARHIQRIFKKKTNNIQHSYTECIQTGHNTLSTNLQHNTCTKRTQHIYTHIENTQNRYNIYTPIMFNILQQIHNNIYNKCTNNL